AGEVTRVALEDGSTIVLNSNTAVRVRYRSGRRDIQLVRGEATFQVRHDPVRPFIVRAGEVQARAVGTEVAVSRATDAGSVTARYPAGPRRGHVTGTARPGPAVHRARGGGAGAGGGYGVRRPPGQRRSVGDGDRRRGGSASRQRGRR